MPMKNPAHPGRMIGSNLDAMRLSVEETALKLQVAPAELAQVIKGQAGVTDALAIGLGELFGNGPDVWRRLQAAYDAAQELNRGLTPAEQPD